MKKRNAPVIIESAGVVSTFGGEPESFWHSLEEGIEKSRIGDRVAAAENPTAYLTDMCVSGVQKAALAAGIDTGDGEGCVIVGTGMGLSDACMQEGASFSLCSLKNTLRKRLYTRVNVLATACCAGAQAVIYAADLLQSGTFRWVIAGGAEAYSKITEAGFQRLAAVDEPYCRPFDRERRGISVGEGAVFFVIRHAEERTRCALAEIAGYGMTSDAYHPTAPAPGGYQAKRAIYAALEAAGISAAQIDAVVAHGTGTPQNDRTEAEILADLFGGADVTAPKSLIGHTGGASGAFGILTAVGMLKRQVIPPIVHLRAPDSAFRNRFVTGAAKERRLGHVLVDCFAFGGCNTAIICRQTQEK